MKVYLDTVSQDITIDDLDGVFIQHPTVGFDLTSLWTYGELYNSQQLWQFKRDGLILLYDENGNDVSQPDVYYAAISDAQSLWANVNFAGGQNLNADQSIVFDTAPQVNTLGITFPTNSQILIPRRSWYDIELKLVGYKGWWGNVWYWVRVAVNGINIGESLANAWMEYYTTGYVEAEGKVRLELFDGDILSISTRRLRDSTPVWIRPWASYLYIAEAKVR